MSCCLINLKWKGAVFMYNRKAFKREAKQLMRESTPHYMLVALVYVLLTTGLSYVVTALTGLGSVLAGTLSVFLSILVSLFSLVMSVGLSYYVLRLARKEPTGVGNLFEGFAFAGRSIGMNLLIMLYTFLWSFLIAIGFAIVVAVGVLLMESVPVVGAILIVAGYIALIVAVFAIVLRYGMANFALVENPNDGASAAIRRSVQMMRGNKGKLFMMELSFIGWNLLVALIALVIMVIGFVVSGTTWMIENILLTGEDIWEVYNVIGSLTGQLTIWTVLAEIVCLPLTLWLTVYMQTSLARFYNYVSGHDYHQYMNGGEVIEQPAQAVPLAEAAPAPEQPAESTAEASEEPPVQPPVNDYYTPAPDPDADVPAAEEPTEPEAPTEEANEEEI